MKMFYKISKSWRMNTRKTHTTEAAILLLAILISVRPCYGAPTALSSPSPSPSPVAPSEKFDLKGFSLGMSKKDVKAVGGKKMICFPVQKINCLFDNICTMEGLSIAGRQTGQTTVFIRNDRVTLLSIQFSNENFTRIAEAFTSKYGKAQTIEKETVKNRLGASFDKVKLGWAIKDASVALTNIDDSVNVGDIDVRPIQMSEQTIECLNKEIEAEKKDL